MVIAPKCSTDKLDIDTMLRYADKHIEIQNFRAKTPNDILNDLVVIEYIIRNSKLLDGLTYHMPTMCVNIEDLTVHKECRDTIRSFILICNQLSLKYNKIIKILFHVEIGINSYIFEQTVKLVKQLKSLCGAGVSLLLENPIANLNCIYDGMSVFMLAKETDTEVCIDITHLQISMYKIDSFLPNNTRAVDVVCGKYKNAVKVTQAHFAKASNRDGVIDRSTHGARHKRRDDAIKDFKLLNEFNIDKSIIVVTEVCELDYSNYAHSEQVKQIKLLNIIKDRIA